VRWFRRAQQPVHRLHRRIESAGLVQQVSQILELLRGGFRTLTLELLFRLQLVERPLMGSVAFPGSDGQGLRIRHDPLGSSQMTGVGPALDLPADAQPVLLKGVVPLDDVLEAETLSRVADLLVPQPPNPALHILLGDQRFELLDAEKVLLVESAQTLHSRLQFFDLSV
jgi:hypothetical protein